MVEVGEVDEWEAELGEVDDMVEDDDDEEESEAEEVRQEEEFCFASFVHILFHL